MAIDFSDASPKPPGIARILTAFGWLAIFGCIGGVMLAFSGQPWVNEIYAYVGGCGSLILGVIFIGQAKTLEALAVLNARMKSRFAMEQLSVSSALGEVKKSTPVATTPTKERVVKIPEDQARSSGLRTR